MGGSKVFKQDYLENWLKFILLPENWNLHGDPLKSKPWVDWKFAYIHLYGYKMEQPNFNLCFIIYISNYEISRLLDFI